MDSAPADSQRVIGWRVAAGLGVLICGSIAWTLFLPDAASGRNDFLALYAGGQLAGTSSLYDSQRVREVQVHAIGEWGPSLRFSRLPYYALLLKPLTLLPYRIAYLIFEVLSVLALLGFALLWPGEDRRTKWLVCCWSLPAFVALLGGQDVSFLLLWIALSIRAYQKDKPGTAGALLALCAAKYHLMILAPVAMVAQRRWRMAAGAAVMGGALLAVSFAVAGPTWPLQYYAVLTDPHIHAGTTSMPNIHALAASMPFAGWFLEVLASSAIVVVLFSASRRHSSFEWALAMALAGGILVSFHTYLMDCAILLPALMLILQAKLSVPTRLVALLLASPLPWFFLKLPEPLPFTARLLLVLLVACMAWALRGQTQTQPRPDQSPNGFEFLRTSVGS